MANSLHSEFLSAKGLDADISGLSPTHATFFTGAGEHLVVEPDLLFHGEYKKLGSDLKLIGRDGHSALIADYFRGGKPPDLWAPDGARIDGDVVELLAASSHLLRYAQNAAPTASASSIGRVTALTGSATVVRNGVAVDLNIGDSVYKADVIQTGSGSSVGIVLTDTSTFQLGANARMVLSELIYDPGRTNNSAILNLVQGTISFVAGQVAKTGDMRVETPSANLGIRGTAVLAEISATDGTTKVSVLVEPSGAVGSFNLYDKATGALIGTVNQAGLVTTISPVGIGQIAQTVTEPKALADIALEQEIARQLFSTYSLGNQTPQNDPGHLPGTKGSPTIFADTGNASGHNDGIPEVSKLVLTASQVPTLPPGFDIKIDLPKPDTFIVVVTLGGSHPTPIFFLDSGDSSVGYLGKQGDPFGRTGLDDSASVISVSGTGSIFEVDLADVVTISNTGLTHTGNVGTLTDSELQSFFHLTPTVVSDGLHFLNRYTWTFEAPAGAFDYLDSHDVLTLNYTIHPSDQYPASTSGNGDITIYVLGHDHPYVTAEGSDTPIYRFLNNDAGSAFTGTGTVVENDPAPDTIKISVAGVTHTGPTSGLTDEDFLSYFSVSPVDPAVLLSAVPGSERFHWAFNYPEFYFDYTPTEMLTLNYIVRPSDDYPQMGIGDGIITILIEPPPNIIQDTSGGDAFLQTQRDYHRSASQTLNEPDLENAVTLSISDVSWDWTNHADNELLSYLCMDELRSFITLPDGPVTDGVHVSNKFTIDFDAPADAFNFLTEDENLHLIYTILPTSDFFGDAENTYGIFDITIHGHHLPETSLVDGIDSAGTTFLWSAGHAPVVRADTGAVYEPNLGTSVRVTVADLTHAGPTGGLSDDELLSLFHVPSELLTNSSADPDHGQISDPPNDGLPGQVGDGHGVYHWTWTFDTGSAQFDFLSLGHWLTLRYQTHPEDINSSFVTPNSDGTTTIVIAGTSNLIGNGDFEAVTPVSDDYDFPDQAAPRAFNDADGLGFIGISTGWFTDNTNVAYVEKIEGATEMLLIGGDFDVETSVSQTVATSAGTHYALDFLLFDGANFVDPDDPVFDQDFFHVLFGGQNIDADLHHEAVGGTEHFWADVVATGPLSTLTFDAQHAEGFWYVDEVALTPELANGSILVADPGDDPDLLVADANGAANKGHFTSEVIDQNNGVVVWHYTIDQSHVAGSESQIYPLSLIHDTDVITITNGDSTLQQKIGVQTGTQQSDIFVFDHAMGAETITNFSHGQAFFNDRIDISDFHSTIHDFAELTNPQAGHILSANGGQDTIIALDASHNIHLENINSATLRAADFIF